MSDLSRLLEGVIFRIPDEEDHNIIEQLLQDMQQQAYGIFGNSNSNSSIHSAPVPPLPVIVPDTILPTHQDANPYMPYQATAENAAPDAVQEYLM